MPLSLYENTSIASHVRSRQRWLILFSLDLEAARDDSCLPEAPLSQIKHSYRLRHRTSRCCRLALLSLTQHMAPRSGASGFCLGGGGWYLSLVSALPEVRRRLRFTTGAVRKPVRTRDAVLSLLWRVAR